MFRPKLAKLRSSPHMILQQMRTARLFAWAASSAAMNAVMDLSSLSDLNTAKFVISVASCQMAILVSNNSRFFSRNLTNALCGIILDLLDNCVGINNRRFYLMLWNTLTLLFALSVYPLVLLDPKASDAVWLKLLIAFQFVLALMGSILGFFYSCFLWYVALKGIY